ncbi:hypothetical protein [Methanolobus bombayensis]|uniref:hypothetical protein n=1 Tax=Methanolobus bombayensis TaxID=38023 RepID=UPI001AE173B2|nr:hypothetical protein [Methanolobus bombayensis]MBP1908390.1 hypothetical protein [Methanolobus bombayensis]
MEEKIPEPEMKIICENNLKMEETGCIKHPHRLHKLKAAVFYWRDGKPFFAIIEPIL